MFNSMDGQILSYNRESMDDLLKPGKVLECPFTWGISQEHAMSVDEKKSDLDDINGLSVLMLMRHLFKVYVCAAKNNFEAAQAQLQAAKKLWRTKFAMPGASLLQDDLRDVSIPMLEHILDSTEYLLLKTFDFEVNFLFSTIRDSRELPWAIDQATLYGCQAIVWSCLYEPELTIGCANLALKEYPDCPLWQFLLGKSLRCGRRMIKQLIPLPDEMRAFKEAAAGAPGNPHYETYLAQMLRESGRYPDARKLYNHVFDRLPRCMSVLLRLALGFLRFKDLPRANSCLDAAEKIDPNHQVYLHYRGLYYKRMNLIEDAAVCFEKVENDGAKILYAECKLKLDNTFKVCEFLGELLKNQTDLVMKQSLLLHLGLVYYFKYDDPQNAVKYFYEAIMLHPSNSQLNSAYNIVIGKATNIYQLVKFKLMSTCEKGKWIDNSQALKIADYEILDSHCVNYMVVGKSGKGKKQEYNE